MLSRGAGWGEQGERLRVRGVGRVWCVHTRGALSIGTHRDDKNWHETPNPNCVYPFWG